MIKQLDSIGSTNCIKPIENWIAILYSLERLKPLEAFNLIIWFTAGYDKVIITYHCKRYVSPAELSEYSVSDKPCYPHHIQNFEYLN